MMNFPEDLKQEIEVQSESEFNNPSPDFGDRIMDLINIETGEELDEEIVNKINNWQGRIPAFTSWRDLFKWVWKLIKDWWDSLWN